jgi:uncharacterized protein involved in tolerance to divalent cations
MKTTTDKADELTKVIKQNHPYECPEVIMIDI